MTLSRTLIFLSWLLILPIVHSEEQAPRTVSSNSEELERDCSGIQGNLKKECRSIKRFTKSTPQSKVSTLKELKIRETISITSSVKLPEDI